MTVLYKNSEEVTYKQGFYDLMGFLYRRIFSFHFRWNSNLSNKHYVIETMQYIKGFKLLKQYKL